ncbi:hypothetical protein V8C44DRAFT_117053 [Trichoderma aethiopicum]
MSLADGGQRYGHMLQRGPSFMASPEGSIVQRLAITSTDETGSSFDRAVITEGLEQSFTLQPGVCGLGCTLVQLKWIRCPRIISCCQMDRPAPGNSKRANLEAACHLGVPNHQENDLLAGDIMYYALCPYIGRAAAVLGTAISAALHRDIDKDGLPSQPLTARRGPRLLPTGCYCPRDTYALHRSGLAIVVARYDGHRDAVRPGAEIELTQHAGVRDPRAT